MPLIGLRKKNELCKICNMFDEHILNEITIDILLHRRTYKDIRLHYSKFLPKGVAKLNDVNINSHRKHSDPKLIADEYLKKKGQPVTDQEIISKLFSEMFKEQLDKKQITEAIYRQRLLNLQKLQKLLTSKEKAHDKVEREIDAVEQIEKNKRNKDQADDLRNLYTRKYDLEGVMRSLIKQIDGIHDDIQQIIVKEDNSDKGIGEGTIHITQNFVNVFESSLKGYLNEIIPFLMMQEFKDDPEKGRRIISMLTRNMDKHLAPAFAETKLLNQHPS